MTGIVIAIDGPSGSGKSTVSKQVASELEMSYLDTGAMYRAATWWCLELDIDLDDTEQVAAAVRQTHLEMITDADEPRVICDGQDVTEAIRSSEISTRVSLVATNLQVRDEMHRRQREAIAAGIEEGRGIIAEGRDITTVVAPEAEVRVLLTANASARLARRSLELHGDVGERSLAATRDEVVRRDDDDATVSTFHTAADGVTMIDSSELSFEDTVAAVRQLATGALA